MIIIIPDLPSDLKERLLIYLSSSLPGRLSTVDTLNDAQDYIFESIYFSWYNRYSKRVSAVLFLIQLIVILMYILGRWRTG